MTAPEALYQSTLSSLKLRARGKVRDIYDIDDKYMLIVTTDRLSAFDVILPDPIPGKGRVLTRISNFWFKKLQLLCPTIWRIFRWSRLCLMLLSVPRLKDGLL